MRNTNRKNNQLRNIELIPDYNPYAEGSCLVKFGNTDRKSTRLNSSHPE